jgi:pyruvate,orthophosphate dikinase
VAVISKGQGASPGRASGPLALSAEAAIRAAESGKAPIFVRNEMDAADVPAIRAAAGEVIARGGITADGAVAARALNKPCIVGCTGIVVSGGSLRVGKAMILEGATLTIDGGAGTIETD